MEETEKRPPSNSGGLSDEEKRRLERRERARARRRDAEDDYGHSDGGASDLLGGSLMDMLSESLSSCLFSGATSPGANLGLVYALGRAGRKGAVGLQRTGVTGWGFGLWLPGNIDQGSDTIDASIPHDDYYIETSRRAYGLQVLYSTGSRSVALLMGVGLSVNQAFHTAVSNASGWRWDAGSESTLRPAAQIGCRLRLGRPISLQAGYDTSQQGYLGLAAHF